MIPANEWIAVAAMSFGTVAGVWGYWKHVQADTYKQANGRAEDLLRLDLEVIQIQAGKIEDLEKKLDAAYSGNFDLRDSRTRLADAAADLLKQPCRCEGCSQVQIDRLREALTVEGGYL